MEFLFSEESLARILELVLAKLPLSGAACSSIVTSNVRVEFDPEVGNLRGSGTSRFFFSDGGMVQAKWQIAVDVSLDINPMVEVHATKVYFPDETIPVVH